MNTKRLVLTKKMQVSLQEVMIFHNFYYQCLSAISANLSQHHTGGDLPVLTNRAECKLDLAASLPLHAPCPLTVKFAEGEFEESGPQLPHYNQKQYCTIYFRVANMIIIRVITVVLHMIIQIFLRATNLALHIYICFNRI